VLDVLNSSILALPSYFTDANKRIFALYLASALIMAIPVFWAATSHTAERTISRFLAFVFPKRIWLHQSAKQDYVLWVLNKILKALLFGPIVLTMVPVALFFADGLVWLFGSFTPLTWSKASVIAVFTFALFIVDDLTRFLLHLALHKIDFLWHFHAVHHSAKVLTPFTIYRSHPVESYLYACRMAIVQGSVVGCGYYFFGDSLSMFDVLGANVFVFIFNLCGSNLRHSHIWFSFGDKVEGVFISPAQHQIHHSNNPIHFDTNLGSALAIWDRLSGTLIKASEVNNIEIGIGKYDVKHNSIAEIYWRPVVNAVMSLKPKRYGSVKNNAKIQP
jgi:sterol desaturase/sphingolipid hydroxylase (fatty acid hydroxylase superfamily)